MEIARALGGWPSIMLLMNQFPGLDPLTLAVILARQRSLLTPRTNANS